MMLVARTRLSDVADASRATATFVDTDGTVRVTIGDAAFASAAWLASSIAHEVEVHVDRKVRKRHTGRFGVVQLALLDEVEAYDQRAHECLAPRTGANPVPRGPVTRFTSSSRHTIVAPQSSPVDAVRAG